MSDSQGWDAWRVTFRRTRFTPSYKRESIIIAAPPGDLQALLRVLRSEHDEALIEKAEHIGPALVSG